MNKRIPFYYITILWVVAVISVLFILRRPALSINEKKNNGRITNLTGSNENVKSTDKKVAAKTQKNKIKDVKDTGDLIFYDKTAFIRHFSDKYSEQELASLYYNAVNSSTNAKEKTLIQVVRKKNKGNSKNSFSRDFDIRPLPVKIN